MRSALILAVLVTFGVLRAEAGPRREPDEQGGWALYAGAAPWGAGEGIFLVGDDWAPQVFGGVPKDLQVGAQGRLQWRSERGKPVRQVVEFDLAEVPVRADDLAEGAFEPAIFKGRPRRSAALLLRGLVPRDTRVLSLIGRWYKAGELTTTEWAFLLRAGGFAKALHAAAKKEPAATYELLGLLWQEQRWGAARALLHGQAKRLDPLLAARQEAACAPARENRGPAPPWARLLELAALHAQGKEGGARKGLKALLRKAPLLHASLCPDAQALPEHELFLPDRPQALLARVPGFVRLLAE